MLDTKFIAGVPDSKIKEEIKGWHKTHDHITAPDEGIAVGLAVGNYLATGEIPYVYMQSDGLCNALNAITSLVLPYYIPLIIVLSIRRKHPQHEVMSEMYKDIMEGVYFSNMKNLIEFEIYDN